jgi:hypothetical protein
MSPLKHGALVVSMRYSLKRLFFGTTTVLNVLSYSEVVQQEKNKHKKKNYKYRPTTKMPCQALYFQYTKHRR